MGRLHEPMRESLPPNRRMRADAGHAPDLLDAARQADGEPQRNDLREDPTPFLRIQGELLQVPAVARPDPTDCRLVPRAPERDEAEPERIDRIDFVVRAHFHGPTTARGGGFEPPSAERTGLATPRPTRLGDPRRRGPSRTGL